MRKDIEYRLAKQDSFCRGCDKKMKKGVNMMVTFYSFRNQGQYIHICPYCVKHMHNLLPDMPLEGAVRPSDGVSP